MVTRKRENRTSWDQQAMSCCKQADAERQELSEIVERGAAARSRTTHTSDNRRSSARF